MKWTLRVLSSLREVVGLCMETGVFLRYGGEGSQELYTAVDCLEPLRMVLNSYVIIVIRRKGPAL